MMMLMVVVMPVMSASFRRRRQLAVQVGGHQFFDRCVRNAGTDQNRLLCKKRDGPRANSAGDDKAGALLAHPAGEKSWRVLRRNHGPGVDYFPLFRVHLHKGEFSAAAKMSVKPSVGCGNCDGYHESVFSFVGPAAHAPPAFLGCILCYLQVLRPSRRNTRANGIKPLFTRGCPAFTPASPVENLKTARRRVGQGLFPARLQNPQRLLEHPPRMFEMRDDNRHCQKPGRPVAPASNLAVR
jgi:hypothetical protein